MVSKAANKLLRDMAAEYNRRGCRFRILFTYTSSITGKELAKVVINGKVKYITLTQETGR